MSQIVIDRPDTREFESVGELRVREARDYAIVDAADWVEAGERMKAIATNRGAVEARLDPLRAKAHEAWKGVVALIKALTDPLDRARDLYQSKRITWSAEQERQRQKAEHRAREAARREEEARRLEEAIAIEEAGDPQLAEALLAEPVVAPPIILPSLVPKLEGVSQRRTWKARVVDEASVPREWMAVDQKKLDAYARATRGSAHVPGVEFYAVDSEAVRT